MYIASSDEALVTVSFEIRYFLVLFLQTDFDVVAIKTRIHEFVSTRQMYISYRRIHHQTYTFETLCNYKIEKKNTLVYYFNPLPWNKVFK